MGVLRRLAVGTCICMTASLALAATEAEKQAAIDNGLEWLAQSQQGNGRWEYGDTGSDTAATGAAVLAFVEQSTLR